MKQRLDTQSIKALKEIRECRGINLFCKNAQITDKTFGRLEKNKPCSKSIITRVKEQITLLAL